MSNYGRLLVGLMAATVAFVLACAPAAEPTATPRPTATPAPTFTPIPTSTPIPGAPTPTPVRVAIPTPTTALLPTATLTAAVPSGELTVLVTSEPPALDPIIGGANQPWYDFWAEVIEPLVRMDDKLKNQGLLAESWQVVDASTWVFNIRKGVEFHNGRKMDADDVLFSLNRMQQYPASSNRWRQAGVVGVEKVNDFTIKILTQGQIPTILFQGQSQLSWAAVYPKDFYSNTPKPETLNTLVGTGPFKFVKWVKGEQLTLEANPKYWQKGLPKLARVNVKAVPEQSTRVAGLKTGQAHIIEALTPDQAKVLERDPATKVAETTGARRFFLHTRVDMLTDARVRLATNLAIDRKALVNDLFLGRATELVSVMLPPRGNPNLKPIPYDPAKARALVKEAGFKPGKPLLIDYPSGKYIGGEQLVLVVSQWLTEVGIPTQPKPWDSAVQSKRWSDRVSNEFYLQGNIASGQPFQDMLVTSLQFSIYGGRWGEITPKGKEYEQLYAQTLRTDPEQALKIAWRMEELFREDNPMIVLYIPNAILGLRSEVQDFKPYFNEWISVAGVWLKR